MSDQKITPFLWFDGRAEEAMNFYTSIFKNSKKGEVSRWGEGSPYPTGTAMSVNFTLNGQDFMGLNAGPNFKFNEAISFYVNVETQQELDDLWYKLVADGGEESMCGWLKDKFGLSWQIIPGVLGGLLGDPDPARAGRAMNAMLQMRKLDISKLQTAADGK